MLDDRDYMRQPEYREPMFPGFRWSYTVYFLIAYVVVFLVQLILPRIDPEAAGKFYDLFALSNTGLAHGYIWQLVTYQFMHGGFLHLFFNCWAIYTFGIVLEYELGRLRFLVLMLSSGIVGGVFQSVLSYFFPLVFGGGVVGASACAFGLVAVFAMLFPALELTTFIFMIFPVTLPARTLLIASVVLALLGIAVNALAAAKVIPFTSNIAHAAHLGGMAMGWFYARKIMPGGWSGLSGMLRRRNDNRTERPRSEPEQAGSDTEFLARQVDPILEKISAHGMQSLTKREREILEAARKKMTRT